MTFVRRAVRAVVRVEPFGTLARGLASRIRRDGLLAEDLRDDGTRGARFERYDDVAPVNVIFDPQERGGTLRSW